MPPERWTSCVESMYDLRVWVAFAASLRGRREPPDLDGAVRPVAVSEGSPADVACPLFSNTDRTAGGCEASENNGFSRANLNESRGRAWRARDSKKAKR